MGVLDTAKPFHRIEIFDPDATEPKYVISPNVFLDTEKPGNNDQVGEIYLTNLNIVSSLYTGANICELELKHEPNTAPAIEMDSLVKVYLGYYNEDYTQGPEYSLVFTGYLTRQQVHLRQTSLECKSRLNKIITLRKKMTFSRQMTIDEIIQKLAIDDGGLELASNGITSSNINKLPGFGFSEQQPLLDHVKLLAGYNGFNVYMDINDKFHASGWAPDDLRDGPGTQNVDWLDDRGKNESENSNIYKHTFTFGSDLMECEFELSAGKCSAVEITGFIAQSDDLTHTIDPPKVEFTPETGADSNLPKQIFKLPHVTREDAEKIAENLYWRLNRRLTGKIKVLGSPQVRLGDGIKIAGEVYDVEPFANFNFDTDNSGDQATLESKTLQVVKVNHRFNHNDGFISRLDLAEGRVAVGVGAEEEAEEGEEEEEEEETEEEEEEEEEEEAEEGEEGEETEEEEEEEEEGTMTAHVLEIEDALFHHDSAVILPEQPTGPSSEDGMGPSDETEQITGISVISSIYNYLDENPDKQLIIAGHTDTSGRVKYNFELSALRSWSVFYLLMGDKVRWAENSNRKNKVEDYQQILKHYARLWGWDCDPGEINDELNAPTREAIRKFQVKYNAEFGQNISVDGIMGPQTWGAFFDCYIRELATMQNTTPEGLAEKRDKIKYVSDTYKILACGESHPIEEAKRDNYRSQINRRVEVLFFDSDKVPELNCPSPTGPYNDVVCDMETCPIYKEGAYEFEHISPETAIL
jgi:outer membrane protein OmpA-like peptidoglycan-associated protein